MNLHKNVVCRISYQCRDLSGRGDDVDQGTLLGYWTGDIDSWGKYSIRRVSSRQTFYLFQDEIIAVEEN